MNTAIPRRRPLRDFRTVRESVGPTRGGDLTKAVQQLTSSRLFREANEHVRRAVNGFPEDRLDDPPVEDPRYSAYTQFIGLTQHDAYHAGQIVLLERAARAERRRATHGA